MFNGKKVIVSHAPFSHVGSRISERSLHKIFALLPAVFLGIFFYGAPALGAAALSVSTAVMWESLFNRVAKRPDTVADGDAALIGLLFAALIPATSPWWFVVVGTFIAVVIGKQIFGGIGANPVNPVLLAVAILMVSWKDLLDFDAALLNYDLAFKALEPLKALKGLGVEAAADFSMGDLLMGRQVGGVGATFGLGLIAGGLYLIARGFIRWEIPVSFLAGVFVTALFFNMADPAAYAGPLFHIFTGYTLIGAFFLAAEDASSPVHLIPMLIYGAGAGIMVILIRNIGVYADGVVFAILVFNLINPLLDKIRPKAMGKVI
ncbi:Electron transporter RnfD [Candidatus Desulfarcum epimagneticum]|uniref:Electron transporter RnfD n=1 Tax=uncultured Desulfobacteraceae bacterium TaxID=218296 RepID=A0A484HP01_9BACT|nr:Electron transporter RnfD [uncultured Desulfobacteraceae bacterium]